eukprot:scaffold2960_cov179-Chaetoceros_neogracile.AAC.2
MAGIKLINKVAVGEQLGTSGNNRELAIGTCTEREMKSTKNLGFESSSSSLYIPRPQHADVQY